MQIKFCAYCGGKCEKKIPKGDDHVRSVCTQCKAIHYKNPKLINGVIIEHKGQILLAKRAIEPRYGTWTIPAGFMELKETTQAGAVRECWEETEAKLKNVQLFGVYNIIANSQVYVIFHAQLDGEHFKPTEESLDVQLFDPENIPWDEIAFPCVTQALKRYTQEMSERTFSVVEEDVTEDFVGSRSNGYFDE